MTPRYLMYLSWGLLVMMECVLLAVSDNLLASLLISSVAWMGGCLSVRIFDDRAGVNRGEPKA